MEENLQELYRRVAFNICVGNTDDHFRNHGFLLTAKGWTLSPAYDMNPTPNDYQSLLTNASTSKSDLEILRHSCEEYMLPSQTADTIIAEVTKTVESWQKFAIRIGIPKHEIERMSRCFKV